jgi:hypothetical protein
LVTTVAIAAVWLLAAPAAAHIGHVILRAERYLKLDVAGNGARVVVSLTLGEQEGRRVLEAADADGDGEVDAAEADAYLAQWARGLGAEVPIRVDGEPVDVDWGEGYFDPVGAVRPVPVTVEMIARLELEGEQTVTIEDRMVRREVFDRTDVAFRAREGAELLASGADDAPSEVIEDLAYGASFRDGEPVTLTAVVRTPERPLEVPWVWVLLGGAGLVIGLVVWVVARRRRR